MEREEGSNGGNRSCYYSVLGLRKDASSSDIRSAYRKLALKLHPDKRANNPSIDADRRFQQLQEAYSVLSDQSKRTMYDAGIYDPTEEQDEGYCEFMQEMLSMMDNVKGEKDSLEDLQKLFVEMVGGDGMCFDFNPNPTAAKKSCSGTTKGSVPGKRSSSCC